MNEIDKLQDKIDFKLGDIVSGFKIVSIDKLEEYNSYGIRALHISSGLEAYHFFTDDIENLFSFSFKTPPSSNQGVAHIIEHSVLSGSKRFPIKDPFQAFLKGSVNTFLNAMTYPDKTLFPAATVLEKDYFNIMEVYADAVFNPILSKEIFAQEAYRIEKNTDGNYFAQGIVFNEMQGSYSNKERLMYEYSYQMLFPDTPYRFDSGGVPSVIPELDYEDFLKFYANFYHPNNCRLFLYGDISSVKQFEFLDREFLSDIRASEGNKVGDILLQKKWNSPRNFSFSSPSVEGDDGLSMVTVNWLFGENSSPRIALAYELLSAVLLSNPGSSLYKALMDTKLGEDISPASGVDCGMLQSVFSCGLRGVKEDDCKGFDEIVIKLLKKIVKEGIKKSDIEGVLRRFEFRYREIRGGIPNGLRMLDRAMDGWLHGKNPTDFLLVEKVLLELRAEIETTPRFFEDMIDSLLINNMHRSEIIIVPDLKESERESEKLAKIIETRVKKEQAKNPQFPIAEVENFYTYQDKDDNIEDLNKMPNLSRTDLPNDVRNLDLDIIRLDGGGNLFVHNHFSNRISYYSFVLDLKDLTDEQLLLIPLLARMMTSSSIPGESYHDVAQKVSLLTGGFYPLSETGTKVVDDSFGNDISNLSFRVKMVDEMIDDALSYVVRILKESKMDDFVRLKEVILEMKNDYISSIAPEGTQFALSWGKKRLSSSFKREEYWRGLSQYAAVDYLATLDTNGLHTIASILDSLRKKLLVKNRITFSASCDFAVTNKIKLISNSIFSSLPNESTEINSFGLESILKERFNWFSCDANKGGISIFEIPTGVAYNTLVLPSVSFQDDLSVPTQVLSMLLNTDYLWSNVRMKGGAYGGGSSLNNLEGFFSFYSFRDPSLGSTYKHFNNSLTSLINGQLEFSEIEKAIITIAGREMRPLKPSERGVLAYRRRLYGISDDMRIQRREKLLGLTVDDIKRSADLLISKFNQSISVSIAGKELLLAKKNKLNSNYNKVEKYFLTI